MTSIAMDSKRVIFFLSLIVSTFAEEVKPSEKVSVETVKPKRGLVGLDDYGFNSFASPNFAPSSFPTKGLSPLFYPENKIPSSLNAGFKIPDPEAFQFNLNQSPIFGSDTLNFEQNYESLLTNPEFQSFGHPQTYQPSAIPQSYQNLGLFQTYQPSSTLQNHQPLGLSQTYQPSSTLQNHQPLGLSQTYQPSEISQSYQPLTHPQFYQQLAPQKYDSLRHPEIFQSPNQQYSKSQVKEEVKPIVEERQE